MSFEDWLSDVAVSVGNVVSLECGVKTMKVVWARNAETWGGDTVNVLLIMPGRKASTAELKRAKGEGSVTCLDISDRVWL